MLRDDAYLLDMLIYARKARSFSAGAAWDCVIVLCMITHASSFPESGKSWRTTYRRSSRHSKKSYRQRKTENVFCIPVTIHYPLLLALQQQRYRPVVDQLDFHVLTESAGGHFDSLLGDCVDEDLV